MTMITTDHFDLDFHITSISKGVLFKVPLWWKSSF